MRRLARFAAALLVGSSWPVSAALAAGWEQSPGGEWRFTDRIVTSGFFTCGSPTEYRVPGSCTASGNTLLLRSGSSELTVTFSGLIQTITSSNVRSAPIAMGTLSTVVTGGPFTMPSVFSDQATLFTFTLVLSGDLGGTRNVRSGYTAAARTGLPYNCCDSFATYTTLGIPGMPSNLRYTGSLYDNFAGRDIAFNGTSSVVTARVGLVPEPSTYALMGTGLLALVVVTRARNARRH